MSILQTTSTPGLFEPRDARLVATATSQFIKYMGSKAKILGFVVAGIDKVYAGGGVCDLFAGSAILSGAIGQQVPMMSNDIQRYSAVLAANYLLSWRDERTFKTSEQLIKAAEKIVRNAKRTLPDGLAYPANATLKQFNAIDELNRSLINVTFAHRWHLFLKNYSGTWWSAEQCLWIDALRQVAEQEKDKPHYYLVLTCLMHAMAYCSQGTGHYAQWREAKTESSMRDIAIYRARSIRDYFVRKYETATKLLPSQPIELKHEITSLDFIARLATLQPCTVYADPPYCFVHYSRFYHAIETLVAYDYPELQIKGGKVVKGRYRDDRHQSPFCIGTQVPDTFRSLFDGVREAKSNLVLSYSNTGMIALEELIDLANATLGAHYKIDTQYIDHKHMTMGRLADRHRDVEECLLLAKRK